MHHLNNTSKITGENPLNHLKKKVVIFLIKWKSLYSCQTFVLERSEVLKVKRSLNVAPPSYEHHLTRKRIQQSRRE